MSPWVRFRLPSASVSNSGSADRRTTRNVRCLVARRKSADRRFTSLLRPGNSPLTPGVDYIISRGSPTRRSTIQGYSHGAGSRAMLRNVDANVLPWRKSLLKVRVEIARVRPEVDIVGKGNRNQIHFVSWAGNEVLTVRGHRDSVSLKCENPLCLLPEYHRLTLFVE